MNIDDIVLTEDALDWVKRRGRPVCSTDFIGYLFELGYLYKRFKKIGGAIDVFGRFRVYSINKKNPFMTNKQAMRVYKKLMKLGFLKIDDDPFVEFSNSKNINLPHESTLFLEQPLFLEVSQLDALHGYNNGVVFPQDHIDGVQSEI